MHPTNHRIFPESTRHLLRGLIADVLEVSACESILVYGSWAMLRNTSNSDIDLLILSEANIRKRQFFQTNTQAVDIYQSCVSDLRSAIAADRWDNHNFLLYALWQSQVLHDPSGVGAALISDARKLWSAGPTPATRNELDRLKLLLQKVHGTMSHAMGKDMNDDTERGLETVRATHLFTKCVAADCRISRLWMANYPEMITWDCVQYERLRNHILSFVRSQDAHMKCHQVMVHAESLLAQLSD